MKACVVLLASLFVNDTGDLCEYRFELPPPDTRYCFYSRRVDRERWNLWAWFDHANEKGGLRTGGYSREVPDGIEIKRVVVGVGEVCP